MKVGPAGSRRGGWLPPLSPAIASATTLMLRSPRQTQGARAP